MNHANAIPSCSAVKLARCDDAMINVINDGVLAIYYEKYITFSLKCLYKN